MGVVRNRQLYILHMYYRGCIPFIFSHFFIIYTTHRKFFFYNSHDLPQKNYTHQPQKKKYTTRRFVLDTTYIFHGKGILSDLEFHMLLKTCNTNVGKMSHSPFFPRQKQF